MESILRGILFLGLLAFLPNGAAAQLSISPSFGLFSAFPKFTGESESVLGLDESARIIESPVFGITVEKQIAKSISITSKFHYSRIYMKAKIWSFTPYDGIRANNCQLNLGANFNLKKLSIGTHFFTQWTTQLKAVYRKNDYSQLAGLSNSLGIGPSLSLSYQIANIGLRCFYNLPLKSTFKSPGWENAIYLDDSFGIEGYYRFEFGKK